MGRFDTTKATINANIKKNGNQEITGSILNSVMTEMVDATDAQLTELSEETTMLEANSAKWVSGIAYNLSIGQQPTQNETTGYISAITSVEQGNKIRICARSGSSYYTYATLLNGVVVGLSQKGETIDTEMVCDGSYDTIIVNNYNSYVNTPEFAIIKSKAPINKVVESCETDIKSTQDYLQQVKTQLGETTEVYTETIAKTIRTMDFEFPFKKGQKVSVVLLNNSVKMNSGIEVYARVGSNNTIPIGTFYAIGETLELTFEKDAPLGLRCNNKDANTFYAVSIKVEEFIKGKISETLPLESKTLAFIGDSAIQVGNYEMTARCAELLGANHYNFAIGGHTWKNTITNGEYKKCCKLLVDQLINSGITPDVIVFQIGGNDLEYMDSLGTLDGAFSSYSWQPLAQDQTIYGGIRYNLQRTMDAFPNAKIVVGTVFQRRGDDATKIAGPVREVCAKLAIPIMDGNLYSGISRYRELINPVYSDNPDGQNKGTREYPQYMWVETDGTIVSADNKSSNAVKVYGKYTYDGTHRTLEGDNHVAEWMASQLASICKY